MSAHTPGPWRFVNGDQIRSERHQIARTWSMRGGEGSANARLIAAAPELLDAAQALLAAWNALLPNNKLFKVGAADDLEDMEFREMNALRAAIAKATGSAA